MVLVMEGHSSKSYGVFNGLAITMPTSSSSAVDLMSIPSWAETAPLHYPASYNVQTPLDSTPFPKDPVANSRISLWEGDITDLRVDAIIVPIDESASDRSSLSDRLFLKAGPGLKRELSEELADCRTGDLVVTNGYRLPARYVIHTIGPKYNSKFHTAAENSLHNCYRNILQRCYDMRLSTVGICVINSVKKNFPPDEGAHIALRTIRRFVETYPRYPSRLVLVVESADAGIYEVLTPMYFPRSAKEERTAMLQLPAKEIGPAGEPVFPERRIRIIDNPQHITDDCSVIDLSGHYDSCNDSGGGGGSRGTMVDTSHDNQNELDRERLLGEPGPARPIIDPVVHREIHAAERYERLVRRAKTEDLSEISGIGCLYQCGYDRFGRPLIVFVGRWFRFKDINLDKALLYLIYLLDPLVKSDYVIAYFHTNTSNANYPSLTWLKEVYNILPYKYKKNLKAFYIIHPTMWTKMMTWWFTTFMAPAIKNKVHSLPGVEYLYTAVRPTDLEIPAFITEHDMTVNGIRYFNYAAST